MYTLYRLNADDLNERFLESLRALFQGKDIEISVCEATDQTDDETEYLLRRPIVNVSWRPSPMSDMAKPFRSTLTACNEARGLRESCLPVETARHPL